MSSTSGGADVLEESNIPTDQPKETEEMQALEKNPGNQLGISPDDTVTQDSKHSLSVAQLEQLFNHNFDDILKVEANLLRHRARRTLFRPFLRPTYLEEPHRYISDGITVLNDTESTLGNLHEIASELEKGIQRTKAELEYIQIMERMVRIYDETKGYLEQLLGLVAKESEDYQWFECLVEGIEHEKVTWMGRLRVKYMKA